MKRRKKVAWIVKSSTESGADYKVKAFKNREDAVEYEFQHREEYKNNLWIEKRSY
jgi:hypothetical protein